MPGVPGPRLAMIETEFVLGRFEASLDGPTETRDTGQLGKRCSEWCEADVISSLIYVPQVPTNEQPMFPLGFLRPQ